MDVGHQCACSETVGLRAINPENLYHCTDIILVLTFTARAAMLARY